ncbi:MAG: DUF1553 domain-containing protein [Planctomycetaceae bacterium]|nr:DUF1553 domain-containing protein [Planctomycetaceae bacterium]
MYLLHQRLFIQTACSVILLAGTAFAAGTKASVQDEERFFEAKVRPLLVNNCYECHSEEIAEAGLRLDSRQSVLKGSDTGAVVELGDIQKSKMLTVIKASGELAMPPDGKLTAGEIKILEEWVIRGLPWSGVGSKENPISNENNSIPERIASTKKNHWSFQPICRHELPVLSEDLPVRLREKWSNNRIDRFLADAMLQQGIQPAEEAPPHALIRRLSYDLTGLPPSVDDVEAFVADPSESAYRAYAERLLDSTQHAEHWARYWLDLARYADTIGYAFGGQSNKSPFAWTYRDWVVKAFHDDLPYNRFVTLQLVADLVTPEVPRKDLAALGFLTVGRTFRGNVHDIIDDRIDLVTRGLMGLSVACARCHDHKYEPIGIDDYYALHGIFASTETPEELPIIGEPPQTKEASAFAEKMAQLEQDVADHERAIYDRAIREAVAHAPDYLIEVAQPSGKKDGRLPQMQDGYEMRSIILGRLERLLRAKSDTHPILGPWVHFSKLSVETITSDADKILKQCIESIPNLNMCVEQELISAKPHSLNDVAVAYGRLIARAVSFETDAVENLSQESKDLHSLWLVFGKPGTPFVVLENEWKSVSKRSERDEYSKRKRRVLAHQAGVPGGPPRAMVLFDKSKPTESFVFLRGNPGRRGEKIDRRVPYVLGGECVDKRTSGRLDLAEMIVDPKNPLTARVFVNWVWTHHFGQGLIATPGDLGLRGEPPSHPELLDDLARRFVEDGKWRIRWLHREIISSQAWRQASTAKQAILASDPENISYSRSRRRRLSWESWRDSLLMAAGTLDLNARGGPGMDPLDPDNGARRTLYSWVDRQDVPGVLRTFDIANPDTAVHVRSTTLVPQQGLVMLNSPLVIDAAKKVAGRLSDESSTQARIKQLWRIVLTRSPQPDEIQMVQKWIRKSNGSLSNDFGVWPQLAQALMSTAEFQYVD